MGPGAEVMSTRCQTRVTDCIYESHQGRHHLFHEGNDAVEDDESGYNKIGEAVPRGLCVGQHPLAVYVFKVGGALCAVMAEDA